MFLRESRHKRVNGEVVVYLQLAESVWNPETKRAETRVVHNCGRATDEATVSRLRELAKSILSRVAPEDLIKGQQGWKVVNAWPYGDIYVLEQLWARLGMQELLPKVARDVVSKYVRSDQKEVPIERASFAMVANRACAPCSKLYCYEQWLREDTYIEGAQSLRLHHLYRAMDFLEKNKDEFEKTIFFRLGDLFNVDVDLVFYDTTTLHFEIDEEDANGAEDVEVKGSQNSGGKTYEALRQRSKSSKNKRSDVPQVVVGLAVTRDGLPVRSWIFRGDTVDVKTVAKVKEDLRGWKLTRCIFVGDAGMVSENNLVELSKGGGRYILCMPILENSDAERAVAHPGRFRKVTQNLRVKEVTLGDGERRKRYAVCFNPQEAERQRHHRERALAELEEELSAMCPDHIQHTKRECQLRASERYGKYLTPLDGRLQIDPAKVAKYERLDGKFVVHSNDDSLSAEDMALGYKQLQRVENAWRLLKTGIRMRPIFHWTPHRISAHVSLCMLALLLERIAENACGDTWRNIRDDLRQVKLAQLLGPQGEVWQVTTPPEAASKRLKQLNIHPPPTVLHIVAEPTHTPADDGSDNYA
jgi:hypothetical protein